MFHAITICDAYALQWTITTIIFKWFAVRRLHSPRKETSSKLRDWAWSEPRSSVHTCTSIPHRLPERTLKQSLHRVLSTVFFLRSKGRSLTELERASEKCMRLQKTRQEKKSPKKVLDAISLITAPFQTLQSTFGIMEEHCTFSISLNLMNMFRKLPGIDWSSATAEFKMLARNREWKTRTYLSVFLDEYHLIKSSSSITKLVQVNVQREMEARLDKCQQIERNRSLR